jgi:hypothetical protein
MGKLTNLCTCCILNDDIMLKLDCYNDEIVF